MHGTENTLPALSPHKLSLSQLLRLREVLSGLPRQPNLRALLLPKLLKRCDTAVDVVLVLSSAAARQLTANWQALRLQDKALTGAALTAILQPATWPALRQLDLSNNQLDAQGAQALAAWRAAARLEVLRINHNRCERSEEVFFLRAWDIHERQGWQARLNLSCQLPYPPVTVLHTLSFSGTLLSSYDLDILRRTPSVLRLRHFYAANCGLRGREVHDMLSAPGGALEHCEDLDISNNPIYCEGMQFGQVSCRKLQRLHLSCANDVEIQQWASLVPRHFLNYEKIACWLLGANPGLRVLHMAGSLHSSQSFATLINLLDRDHQYLDEYPQLQALDLRNNPQLEDRLLLNLKAPPTLCHLAVHGTGMTPAAVQSWAPGVQLDSAYWQACAAATL